MNLLQLKLLAVLIFPSVNGRKTYCVKNDALSDILRLKASKIFVVIYIVITLSRPFTFC